MSEPKPLSRDQLEVIEAYLGCDVGIPQDHGKELFAAEAFWRGVVKRVVNPWQIADVYGSRDCCFCDSFVPFDGRLEHKPNCSWLLAKEEKGAPR